MIIARTPLRITLGGGGTDLPSYYREHGGFLIAAAIDKYVYITRAPDLHRRSDRQIFGARDASTIDRRAQASDRPRGVQAGRARGARARNHLAWPTFRPAPGSARRAASPPRCSRRCYSHRKMLIHPRELAEQACDIEIDRLREPIGKQDQYIAAFGGLTCFRFNKDDSVEARAAQDRRRDAAQSRRQSAAVLHRLFAQRLVDPEGTGRQDEAAGQRHDRTTCTT